MNKSDCESLRRGIKALAETLWEIRKQPDMADAPAEAYANAMLAFRHLEDASMRLGKAIQALDGGTSVYDKDQVVTTAE